MSNGPLRTNFVITSMPVGGAETLLVNLVQQFDRTRIIPSISCLKERGVLGELLTEQGYPVFDQLINHKLDFAVAGRLKKLFIQEQIDAVVTVGAGDKMFWGRLAARRARVPVVLSALHSTGWPDGVGRLNRMLTRITDGFIACADSHGRFLVEFEKFPPEKVFVIQNGIDTQRFHFNADERKAWREKLGIPESAPVVGIVAALRPEKNHALFLEAAKLTLNDVPDAHFIIAGDGPERESLETLGSDFGISNRVHFLGSVSDIPAILSAIDVFSLTSHNEAKPVSILEALSCQRPVVATNVGSVSESVIHEQTGLLVDEGDLASLHLSWVEYLNNGPLRDSIGRTGRNHVVENSSLEAMTEGYTHLIESLFQKKLARKSGGGIFVSTSSQPSASSVSEIEALS